MSQYTTVMFRQVWGGYELYNANEFFRGMNWLDNGHRARAEQMGWDFFFAESGHFPYTRRLNKQVIVKHRNETGFHPLDCWFDIGIMKAANAYGIKVAICGDSVGTPEVTEWRIRIPALEFAKQYGHYVTLNEYGPYRNGNPSKLDVSTPDGFLYYGGRHRLFYEAVPETARPKLIIGETGSSDSWTYRGFDITTNDMIKYNQELMKDDYVVGACWWTLGNWGGYPQSTMDPDIPRFKEFMRTFG